MFEFQNYLIVMVNPNKAELFEGSFRRGITMRFSGEARCRIILKVTKKLSCTLSLENTFLEKLQGSGEEQTDPPVF